MHCRELDVPTPSGKNTLHTVSSCLISGAVAGYGKKVNKYKINYRVLTPICARPHIAFQTLHACRPSGFPIHFAASGLPMLDPTASVAERLYQLAPSSRHVYAMAMHACHLSCRLHMDMGRHGSSTLK